MKVQIDTSTPWRRFIKLLALERSDIIQIFYYAIFSGIVALSLPLGIQTIINLTQGAQISTSLVVLVILVTIGVIFSGALQFMQLRIIETMQQRIFVRSAFDLSYRFPKIKMEELHSYYPPELANRFFDTLTVQKGLSKVLIDVPTAMLQMFFALILLSFYHSFFVLFGIFLFIVGYFVFQHTFRQGVRTSIIESKSKYRVAHWIQEVARSMVSFKLSGKTNLALRKNDQLVTDYLQSRESHFAIIKTQFIKMLAFKVIITAGLLIIGGALVLSQRINIGQFVAAEIIILYVIASFEKLIVGLETIYDMLTSLEKLGEVADKELEDQQGEKPDFTKGMAIVLEKASYHVPERDLPILSKVSIQIPERARVLIKGESGSGKSTLLQLIAGVILPSRGQLLVNDLSIKSLNLNHYRAHLGLSLSSEMPFEGTLRDNVTFGDTQISDDAIFYALKQVGLYEFLLGLPNGLSTMLYPEGRQVSYTVAKKIVLARAIIKNPKVLILEDALDQFNQEETKRIIDFLCHPSHGWALLVVSSNSYWQKYCKTEILLEGGQISN